MSLFWLLRKRRLLIYLAFIVTLLVFLAVIRFHQGIEHRNTDDEEAKVYLRSNGRQTEYIDKKGMHVVVGKYLMHTVGFLPEKLPLLNLCERSELVYISQLFLSFSQTRHLVGE